MTRPHRFVAMALLTGVAAACAPSAPDRVAGGSSSSLEGEMVVALEERVDRWHELGRFSGAVAAGLDGELVFATARGDADRENGAPNRPDTRFALASLTKQFTAAAVLRLESEGRLRVDDPVAVHLPEYPHGARITLHQLLTHTAGVPSPDRLGDGLEEITATSEEISTERLVSFFADREPLFEPGERFRYSNAGYQLLAAIIERVAGKPYSAYLEEDLFGSQDLQDTTCRLPPERAHPYAGYPGYERRAAEPHPSWSLGDGCALSTALDLVRWGNALVTGGVLPDEQWRRLFEPWAEIDEGVYYGYGWFLSEVLGSPVAHHGGADDGVVVEMLVVPERNLVVAVLANYLPVLGVNAPRAITREVAALILGEPLEPLPTPVPLNPERSNRFAGTWEMGPGRELVIELRGDDLWAVGEPISIFDWGALADVDALEETVGAARSFVTASAAGSAGRAWEMLCEDLRGAMTAAELEGEMVDLLGDSGAGQALEPASTGRYPGESMLTQVFRVGEDDDLFLSIELTPEARVCGWYAMDGAEYETRRQFALPGRVRLLPISSTTLLADGFNYREGHVEIELSAGEGDVDEIILRGAEEHRGLRQRNHP